MESEIVSADQQSSQRPLGERLEASIGETSSGIGVLLSELVRKSLRTSVSDIGDSLVEFAEEKVEVAVQERMPEITEAADAVAQSASKRVVNQAIDELNEKSAEQQRQIETKIDSAESNAFQRSRDHIEEALTGVNESIDQTRSMAVESNDLSQQKIQELREKARHTWLKLKEAFATANEAHDTLRREHVHLRNEHNQLGTNYEHLRKEHDQLGELLTHVRTLHRQQVESAEEKFNGLVLQNQRLEERLSILEQPRGIKGLIAKFRGGGKGESNAESQVIDDPNTAGADEEQGQA